MSFTCGISFFLSLSLDQKAWSHSAYLTTNLNQNFGSIFTLIFPINFNIFFRIISQSSTFEKRSSKIRLFFRLKDQKFMK